MLLPLYYIIIPFVIGAYLIKWLKKVSPAVVPEDVQQLYAAKPCEKKWYRSVRRDHKGLRHLGDFETRQEAVEEAYRGLKSAKAAKEAASFVVLNDKGEALEQVDS